MKAKTLVQSWLEVELVENELKLVQALNELNNNLGTSHAHSRVREWEQNRNNRGINMSRKLRVYMCKKVIRSVLCASGLDVTKMSKKALNKIAERLQ